MDDSRTCPNCGREHSAYSPLGLCPRCLLQQGMDDPDSGESEPQTGFSRPTLLWEPAPSSVLARIANSFGPIPRVSLRETEITNGCAGDCVSPGAELPQSGCRPDRYLFFGEIARGGMGSVLRGRDVDLGRELAVKVLLESHKDKPELVRRFVDEARIGGQLQHPGVVPVYELGTFADNRPFFTMKLVKGRTLAHLLHARRAPADDRPRFLAIFESICQTMAYTHVHGVIHRDLKPSNVMVGDYGEVQVMDWGLAKVLPEESTDGEAPTPRAEPGPANHRGLADTPSGARSQVGSILGTPGYMAPEQARGQAELIDERADVFGLGAILCEILTGEPVGTPRGSDASECDVSRWDLEEISVRLDRCEADRELIDLTRQCLALERDDRPRHAGVVAARISAIRAGVEAQLRRAELAQVEASARAQEEAKRRLLSDALARQAQARATDERRRRKLALALAAAMFALDTIVVAGTTVLFRQRQAHIVRLDAALQEFYLLEHHARSDPTGDVARWHAAVESIRRAESLLGPLSDGASQRKVRALRNEVVAAEEEAIRDQALLEAIVDIRSAQADDPDATESNLAYAAEFRSAGVDVDSLGAQAAAALIKKRPPSVALALAASLDDWASQRRRVRPNARDDWMRLTATARAVDSDPTRDELRQLWAAPDQKAHREKLASLRKSVDIERWPVQSLVLLATVLSDSGEKQSAVSFLHNAQTYHSDDVWINYVLARQLEELRPPQTEEAIRFYSVARALRPETAHELSHALDARGRGDEAIVVLQQLTALRPEISRHWSCLATELKQRGDQAGAKAALAHALETGRAAVRRTPARAEARSNLAAVLLDAGNHGEAITQCREAIRLKPELASAHDNLGVALSARNQTEAAIAEYREAIRLNPDFPNAHHNLAIAFQSQRKLALAIAEYREAIRLRPDSALARFNLAGALRENDELDQATADLRETVRLKPDYAEAHAMLGAFLCRKGEYPEALVEIRRAHELGSTRPDWPFPTELMIRKTEHTIAVEKRLAAVLRADDKLNDPNETLEFAAQCYNTQRYGPSARFFAAALEADPKLAADMTALNRYNAACASVLATSEVGADKRPPDETQKTRLRTQALHWLEADLAHWAGLGRSGAIEPRARAIKMLEHWKADPDLAAIRGEASLKMMPQNERLAWQRLWHQVDDILAPAAIKK